MLTLALRINQGLYICTLYNILGRMKTSLILLILLSISWIICAYPVQDEQKNNRIDRSYSGSDMELSEDQILNLYSDSEDSNCTCQCDGDSSSSPDADIEYDSFSNVLKENNFQKKWKWPHDFVEDQENICTETKDLMIGCSNGGKKCVIEGKRECWVDGTCYGIMYSESEAKVKKCTSNKMKAGSGWRVYLKYDGKFRVY